MSVAVDGRTLIGSAPVRERWTNHAVGVWLAPGTHLVSVSPANPGGTSRCARILRLDFVTLKAGPRLYVDPGSQARAWSDAVRASRPDDAALVDKIASQPQAVWLGEWSGDVRHAVASVMADAGTKVPVFVAYNIPQRDCGSYSAGGPTPDAYRAWISSLAEGIGSGRAIVVLEPDALAGMDCLGASDRATRLELLAYAVDASKSGARTRVYIDAGHSSWLPASQAASRLTQAGIAGADGFSLNVSNFNATSDEVSYGNAVSRLVGGKRFVVDTSRNGAGSNGEWCNPPGRALGRRPTLQTGRALVDAYLWIKRPGESDGTCNAGPPAGDWWADYALGLAARAPW